MNNYATFDRCLALHKALLEAKFHQGTVNNEVFSNPVVADVHSKIVDTLESYNPDWAEWRKISNRPDYLKSVISFLGNSEVWEFSNDMISLIRTCCSPFSVTEEEADSIAKSINELRENNTPSKSFRRLFGFELPPEAQIAYYNSEFFIGTERCYVFDIIITPDSFDAIICCMNEFFNRDEELDKETFDLYHKSFPYGCDLYDSVADEYLWGAAKEIEAVQKNFARFKRFIEVVATKASDGSLHIFIAA
jgi:hypothetical protein